MTFKPCVPDQCTDDGTHCKGCGRSHEEITETKAIVKSLVSFAQKQNYGNIEEFANFIGKNTVKKYYDQS